MRLASLRLSNYRRFDALHLAFDPHLTVLVARNGLGKTTILDALATALGPFVGAFDHGQSKDMVKSDARAYRLGQGLEQEQGFPVEIETTLSEPELTWTRSLKSAKGRSSAKESAALTDLGHALQAQLRTDPETELPVLAYYSSQRLWLNQTGKSKARASVLTQSRSSGYEECLIDRTAQGQLEGWMQQATLRVLQSQHLPQGEDSDLKARLEGVAEAIDTVLKDEAWSHFHFSMGLMALALVHPEHGELPLRLLSDGVRAMATLAGDLALRCVRLNPQWGKEAPKRSRGIVLIDEVDLHLHPSWQQRVVMSLREAFPNLQFIVTTHSPQVLSTVRRHNIRLIFKDSERTWRSLTPTRETLGVESAGLMTEIMGVDPIPKLKETQWLSDYIAYIEQGGHEGPEAKALRQRLSELYEQEHPIMRRLERLIRMQPFKVKKG